MLLVLTGEQWLHLSTIVYNINMHPKYYNRAVQTPVILAPAPAVKTPGPARKF
jgi:hypothetical protein